MKNEAEEKIIKMIKKMAGRYSGDSVFSDWVQCCAITIQNSCQFIHDKDWKERENQFINTINKYSNEEQKEFVKGMIFLSEALETEMTDILGDIYMKSGCGSKQTGQFFTPFHLSYLNAALSVPDDISEENKLIMNEPSTGGGGMIIAAAKVLKERGLNYQNCMKVIAQDLDWRAVYMTYVQLSILGIKAYVVQGDTICKPFNDIRYYPRERVFVTPAKMGVII